jgi:hypothetical protein
MQQEKLSEAQIRQFLLGSVDDLQRERVERLFLSDPESNQRILLAEDDLIDQYLESALSSREKELFLAQYDSPVAQRRLRIIQSIKDYALRQLQPPELFGTKATPVPVSAGWFLANLRWIVPVATAVILAVSIGLWSAVVEKGRRDDLGRRQTIERELADLNRPANIAVARDQIVTLSLAPASMRSLGPRAELKPSTSIRLVEIDLLWLNQPNYSSYQAVVHRFGSRDEFQIGGLRLEKDPSSRQAVHLYLPIHILTNGTYQIVLRGTGNGGEAGAEVEYSFNFLAQ